MQVTGNEWVEAGERLSFLGSRLTISHINYKVGCSCLSIWGQLHHLSLLSSLRMGPSILLLLLLLQAALSLAATSASPHTFFWCSQWPTLRKSFTALTRTCHAAILPPYEVVVRSLAGRLAATSVTCLQRISGFCNQLFFHEAGPALNLHPGESGFSFGV